MQVPAMSYGLLGGLAIALAVAAVTDIRRRQIDNWLNAVIALTAPLFWLAQGLTLAAIGWQLATALAAFVVLAVLFALRAMGGGDVKLLTVLALWIKPEWFLHLLMVMAIAGGILTVVMGVWHVARRQKHKLAVPYGIAIAVAGIWVLVADYLPALQAGGKLG
jgi:prepilin peptidase CpaA